MFALNWFALFLALYVQVMQDQRHVHVPKANRARTRILWILLTWPDSPSRRSSAETKQKPCKLVFQVLLRRVKADTPVVHVSPDGPGALVTTVRTSNEHLSITIYVRIQKYRV